MTRINISKNRNKPHKWTDEEKEYWNDKADKTLATQTENGLMSSTDKKALDDLILKVEQLQNKLQKAVFYD